MSQRRRAVITGGTKGIGWAIAKAYAHGGVDLILSSRSTPELESRKRELLAEYSDLKVWTCAADLSKRAGVQKLVDFILEIDGAIDILVNNAPTG